MKTTPKREFPCAGCGIIIPMFPSQRGTRRCPSCVSVLRSELGTRNAAMRRPAVGARKLRTMCGVTYVLIYEPHHPDSPKNGWMFEHRLVMEKMIGRRLTSAEVVHHLDHDGRNNAPSNLVLESSKGTHLAAHHSAEGVAARLAGYPRCRCGARTAYGEAVCWKCWSMSQTCPSCGRPDRKMARRDMCHGCYKALRVRLGRV